MSEAEIDLNALPDDELVTQMHDDLYDGLAPEIAEGTNILLGRGWAPDKVLNDALVGGCGSSASTSGTDPLRPRCCWPRTR
jgi:methanogenic corrinoid protein MtbC1